MNEQNNFKSQSIFKIKMQIIHKYIYISILFIFQIESILNSKKNLILGAIKNYNWNKIKPFFKSFKYANFKNCDIVLFANGLNQNTTIEIKSYGVIIHEIPEKFKNMIINNYRYKLYSDFLSDKLNQYNMILCTDIRDVIFQNDIFKYFERYNNFLCIALEDGLLSSGYNKKWLIEIFGNSLFNILKDKQIICSGTILGSSKIIYNLCNIIWREINSKNVPSPFNSIMDQSILNYIIYHLKLFDDNIIKSNNKEGPLMTIGITIYRKNICLDSEYNILNDKGQIAAVVHQYDRSLNLTKILRNKFDNIKKLKINSNSYIIIIKI